MEKAKETKEPNKGIEEENTCALRLYSPWPSPELLWYCSDDWYPENASGDRDPPPELRPSASFTGENTPSKICIVYR